MIAREPGLLAEIFGLVSAEVADTIAGIEPGNTDAIAFLQISHAVAARIDNSDDLVSGNDRNLGQREVAFTDLHIVEGDLPLPKIPVVPGHQIVGVVDACGDGVRNLKEGDRVGIPWLYSSDGVCNFCRHQTENLCEQARFTGYHVNGGYAEACVVREDFAHPLPTNFSDERAAPLLCAGVIGYRSYRLGGVRTGQRLGLYGFGASAHLVLQVARYQGCEVCVFTRGAAHQELARRLGAEWTGSAQKPPPAPIDASIQFAPAGTP